METRTRFDAVMDKRNALAAADTAGEVADSMEVRKKLIEQMNRGEKTLVEIQAELETIKRNAKKNGKLTRSQVWSRA